MELRIIGDEDSIIDWAIWKRNKKKIADAMYKGWMRRFGIIDMLGFANKIGGEDIYLIRDKIEDNCIFGVTMHEIGHLLGVEHKEDGLMHKNFDRVRGLGIDKATMDDIAERYGFDVYNYMIKKKE